MNFKKRALTPLALGLSSVTLALGLGAGLYADGEQTPPPKQEAKESLFPEVDTQASLAELEESLENVGPTKAERLEAIESSDAVMKEMRKTVETWNVHNVSTNSSAVRAAARKALLKDRGLKALPIILECLEDDAYWPKREAALACAELVDEFGDEARWLLYHHKVPSKLIGMIGTGPDAHRVGLREEIEAELVEIVGRDPLLVHELSGRTWWSARQNAQREAFVKQVWSENWARIHERWKRVQTERLTYRARLNAAITAAKASNTE